VWFAGGTVDVVQVPGKVFTLAAELHERFEEGTINYLAFPAIVQGLKLLDPLLDLVTRRLDLLVRHLVASLSNLRYPSGKHVVRVLSRTPFHVDQQESTKPESERAGSGSILALQFYDEYEQVIPLSLISYCANKQNISLRTGCMCNPGGASAMLDLFQYMNALTEGATLKEMEGLAGRELGVVRISLGLVSNWSDVERVIRFAFKMGDPVQRSKLAEGWNPPRQEESCCKTQTT